MSGIGISNGQNAAMEWNLLTAELPMISLTVDPFVMCCRSWR
jgi:hypothetical protein